MAEVQVLIIGGGFAGVCMAIKLLQAGLSSFVLIDKLPELGGTWFLNRYPGCRCDIPSHFFCYSFDRNPHWSSMYADRLEIQQYLKNSATRHSILPHVRLNTEALSVAWDTDSSLWLIAVEEKISVEPADGDQKSSGFAVVPSTIKAQFVVRAAGAFHTPKYPELRGMNTFARPAFHSSLWDGSISLEGKTVAVIGTGASSIQVVPGVAPVVKKLYVFQRSPAWVAPKPSNWEFSKRCRAVFARLPVLMLLFYWFLFLVHEVIIWAVLRWRWARRVAEWVVKWNIRRAIKDEALIEKLVPKFAMGCKRILLSNNFYPAMARPNVELVTDAIEEVRETAVVAGGREIALDAMVYATGFELRGDLPIVGSGGVEFKQAGVSALLGITKRGFPNLFTFFGPNSGVAQTSQVLPFEAQARYMLSCIQLVLRRPGARWLEPTEDSERRHQQFLAVRLPKFVWSFGGCTSWYVDARTNHNDTMWPGTTLEYVWHARAVNSRDYEIH